MSLTANIAVQHEPNRKLGISFISLFPQMHARMSYINKALPSHILTIDYRWRVAMLIPAVCLAFSLSLL